MEQESPDCLLGIWGPGPSVQQLVPAAGTVFSPRIEQILLLGETGWLGLVSSATARCHGIRCLLAAAANRQERYLSQSVPNDVDGQVVDCFSASHRDQDYPGLSLIVFGHVTGEAELHVGFPVEGDLYLFQLQVAVLTESEATGWTGRAFRSRAATHDGAIHSKDLDRVFYRLRACHLNVEGIGRGLRGKCEAAAVDKFSATSTCSVPETASSMGWFPCWTWYESMEEGSLEARFFNPSEEYGRRGRSISGISRDGWPPSSSEAVGNAGEGPSVLPSSGTQAVNSRPRPTAVLSVLEKRFMARFYPRPWVWLQLEMVGGQPSEA